MKPAACLLNSNVAFQLSYKLRLSWRHLHFLKRYAASVVKEPQDGYNSFV